MSRTTVSILSLSSERATVQIRVNAAAPAINWTAPLAITQTQYWFVWGISPTALTSTTTKTGSLTGATATAVSATVTTLKSKIKYDYPVVASNVASTTPGKLLSFTTNQGRWQGGIWIGGSLPVCLVSSGVGDCR